MRNNLVAAIQNLSGAKLYVSISLPYCDTQELETLRVAATFIMTDTQSQVCSYLETLECDGLVEARHQHAMECYSTTEQRARGLRHWLQMVIDQIINKDLDQITWKVSKAGQELRDERIRLMKETNYTFKKSVR